MEKIKFTVEGTVNCCLNDYYLAPCIEIVEVSLEKGFADSAADFGDGTW